MPTLRWVVFLCSLGILPAVLQLIFVCAGRMPTLRWVVSLCSLGILPAVLQLVFCSCGQGCPHYGGWFFYVLRAFCPLWRWMILMLVKCYLSTLAIALANKPPSESLPFRIHPQATRLASTTRSRWVFANILKTSPKMFRISNDTIVAFLLPKRS